MRPDEDWPLRRVMVALPEHAVVVSAKIKANKRANTRVVRRHVLTASFLPMGFEPARQIRRRFVILGKRFRQ